MHPWKNYVAVGDSFTEGTGDPVDGFQAIGCMERLAQILKRSQPDFQFTNLAKHGLKIDEVRDMQLQKTLALKPDFITVQAGANDLMKGNFTAEIFESSLRSLFEPLAKTGAFVTTGTHTPFPYISTLDEAIQKRLQRQMDKANEIIRKLAGDYGIVFVDTHAHTADFDAGDWSADQVHLNSRGHFKFTKALVDVLEKHTGVEIGQPEMP